MRFYFNINTFKPFFEMNFKKSLFIVAFLSLSNSVFSQTKIQNVPKPNIIFILTDDLGYGDLGVFYQNQRRQANQRNKPWVMTPYLDQMANNGITLEQYSAAPVCAPSRASLLLGQSQGHANVRDNQFDKALADNYTIGNIMQMAGYKTAAIGKWGLQGSNLFDKNGDLWPAIPTKRGFDSFYGYMRHVDGHEHYPKEGLYRGKKEVYDNEKEVSQYLDNCYTGDLFTARAKDYIIKHTKESKKEPFMLYLAYDTPHAVIELPTSAYPAGFGLKGGLQWLGKEHNMISTANGVPDSYYHPDYVNATYDDDNNASTKEVPWPDVYKKYATVTRRIDDQVNDILVLLKDLKIDENTIVIFTSDNGPSQESYLEKQDYHPSFFGGSGPFDGIKRDVLEGGIREPTIVLWPGHTKAGSVVTKPTSSYDWMPTFADLAGLPAPAICDGTSLLPLITGVGTHEEHPVYVEYFQNGRTPDYDVFIPAHQNKIRNQMQMIRIGDKVAVRYNIKSAEDDFEIFDIDNDTHQAKDLSKTQDMKEFQQLLKAKVLQMRKKNNTAPRPYDETLIPSIVVKKTTKGWLSSEYKNETKWLASNTNKPLKSKRLKTLQAKTNQNLVVLTTYIQIPEDGKYTFTLSAEGKAFLRVHDIALIDQDFGYVSGTEKTETLNLSKGFHPIKLYYQSNNKAMISWKCMDDKGMDISDKVFITKK